jgi:hypothetical protein
MEAVKQPLEEIRKAAENPPAGVGPITNLFGKPAINFVALRMASQWLMGAAICHLHEGRHEDALKDLEALAAMARVNREDYFLVSQMIRVAITGLGVAATWEALAADGWTDAQLERLQKAWEAVSLIEALEKGIVGGRAVGGDLWIMLHDPARSSKWKDIFGASSKPGLESFVADHVLFPLYKLSSIDDDELFHLTAMQEAVETTRLLAQRHPRADAKKHFDQLNNKFGVAFSNPSSRLHYWFSGMTIPNCTRAFETALRNETDRQLLVAAIATFLPGRFVGKDRVRRYAGPRLKRIAKFMEQRGLIAVTAVRLVPIAPFPVVNLAMGALRVRLGHFALGTLIGMLPGMLAATVLSDQLAAALEEPAGVNRWLIAAAILALAMLAFIGQRLLRRSPQ